ncbi:hypothetical protein HMPREF9104_01829 [Lentilactobacillus kisonensis F0435]|uniref:Uncharacterized protein n=1 Tax=Lentilactobacillus kisonensis F0435 TaxID=797516 RepID=H1LGV0_9LACO|nr:hypothetical protein HMPREF9104_01829 [Lentilactobacillus kisonensis F0435]
MIAFFVLNGRNLPFVGALFNIRAVIKVIITNEKMINVLASPVLGLKLLINCKK